MNRLKPARLFGIRFNLRPKSRDVIIDGARGRKGGVAPHQVEETLPRDRLAGGLGHEPKHGKFAGGEVEFFAAAAGNLASQVNLDLAELESHGSLAFTSRSPQ